MALDMVRGLYAYHRWANRRLWDVAVALGEDVAQRDVGTQFSLPTLEGMFAHLYGADRVWLSRWTGDSSARLPGDRDFPSLAGLRPTWAALEAEQNAFLESLGDADLGRPIEYRNLQGTSLRFPLGPLLLHVANHATHHRSEIATMLTMVSGSPPDSGINTYLVETQPGVQARRWA